MVSLLTSEDRRWLAAATAIAARGVGTTYPNPSVGCVLVRNGVIVGRGVTQPGGRPHAEAVALAQAGDGARGCTAYVTLEPCAHGSARGGDCAGALTAAGVARLVIGRLDPDPRTDGKGADRLRAAAIDVVDAGVEDGALAGFLMRRRRERPFVTLKLAMSLDGGIALRSGKSRWITGERARAHAHLERARHDAILVGRGTYDTDTPRLDVRLAGLEQRAPRRVLLSHRVTPAGWTVIADPEAITTLPADTLLVEGGAGAAAAFLRADLVDRLLIYRAPIIIGGLRGVDDLGLPDLGAAHGRWRLDDSRMLGQDRLDTFLRASN
jgi:diaminohydroxyphosphoribosylaminopyrimidine deaminase/5-amino-6-(5-phosphoribosylamino)uracil reductase